VCPVQSTLLREKERKKGRDKKNEIKYIFRKYTFLTHNPTYISAHFEDKTQFYKVGNAKFNNFKNKMFARNVQNFSYKILKYSVCITSTNMYKFINIINIVAKYCNRLISQKIQFQKREKDIYVYYLFTHFFKHVISLPMPS